MRHNSTPYIQTRNNALIRHSVLRALLYTCVVFVCVIWCACTTPKGNGDVLTVSIPAQKWLLDSIAGNRFKVVSLLNSGSNPETFEPTMQQLMEMHNSAAYFTVGSLAFELSSVPKIKENFPDLKIVNTSEGIAPITGTHSIASADGHNHDYDPHVWTSLPNMRIMARNMYEQLLKLDPQGKEYYTARYKNLDTNLAALNDSVREALRPLAQRTFLVWHPSLSYFANDYGLHQAAMEQVGKEASVTQYKEQIDRVRNLKPLIFFTQAEFDSRQAGSLASELGLPTARITIMQPDIPSQIRNITHELTSADN